MPERKIEDRLREEYFNLLPEIREVAWQLETEIRHVTLPIHRSLAHYEQLVVKSRVKECESALKTLRSQQEGNVFDPEKSDTYSILNLRDLAGVRVLVFPRSKLVAVDRTLREYEPFKNWIPDAIKDATGAELAGSYHGLFQEISDKVQAEYQVVPMLIGLFWEVEHSAMYKPIGWAKGIENDPDMRNLRADVESSLAEFEEEFEKFVRKNSQAPSAAT
jgi:ppGpp synthetase/RelA/SpoT-type nucleotidyltranferase